MNLRKEEIFKKSTLNEDQRLGWIKFRNVFSTPIQGTNGNYTVLYGISSLL